MSAPPPASGATERKGPGAAVFSLTAAVLALHLLAAASLHLTEDEAYYRLWARAPALGYFDHPPMIAWWIAAGRALIGDSPLGVRLLPCVLGAAVPFFVFDMARTGGLTAPTARFAAIAYLLTPLALLGGGLAVPDAPAGFFWALALAASLRGARAGTENRRGAALAGWTAAGLAAGLACLSKYSALFLAPGVLLWLTCDRPSRRLLATAGPWVAAALAAALFSFNVAWNAGHHWESFARQFGRVAPHALTPLGPITFAASQLLLFNPALSLLALCGLRVGGGAAWPFIATAAPFAVYLLLHSLHASVEAHWPAPLYAGLAVLAAAGAHALPRPAARAWRIAAAAFAALVMLALGAVVAGWPPFARRLTAPLEGWPRFARAIEARRRAAGAAWVGTLSYGLAAELIDEPAIQAPVVQLSEQARYQDLDLPQADVALPGLLLDLGRRVQGAPLAACFAVVTPLAPLIRGERGHAWRAYAVVRLARRRPGPRGRFCP